jgi:hypothetical protein
MGFDPNSVEHLMSVLTDLYSDRIMAVIREYSTNAHDAHKEAGTTRPIEVTLPSRLSNYYHIKDWGIGLDIDGIRRIYSQYGASTKRGSNEFNGMLGLGCKSAMTYSAQFSIVSVKDGLKYNVAVVRGADGVGEMQVIDTTPTNEPNGVEIIVPVKSGDVWSFAEKAQSFFQWWPEGTVLVNGRPPVRFTGREVEKNIFMIDGAQHDLIVMGNVPYPIPYEDGLYAGGTDQWGRSQKKFGVVYFAEMGEVTFAPNRESLSTTKKTKETVERVSKIFGENIAKSLQAEIDNCADGVAALALEAQFRQRYPASVVDNLKYKGQSFPKEWEAPFKMVDGGKDFYGNKKPQQKEHEPFFMYDPTDTRTGHETLTSFSPTMLVRLAKHMTILVNGPKTITPNHRAKMRKAYEDGVLDSTTLLITSSPTKFGGLFTDSIKVEDWSVVHEQRLRGAGTSDSTKHNVY